MPKYKILTDGGFKGMSNAIGQTVVGKKWN
jgi:hypothetical protein